MDAERQRKHFQRVCRQTQKLGRRRDCYESEREVVVRVTCVEQEAKKQFVYLLQFGYLGLSHLK